MITFLSVAKEYLSTRIVSKHYHDTVLRIANKCQYMTNQDVNEYVKKRLEKYTTITAKTDRTILLALFRTQNEWLGRKKLFRLWTDKKKYTDYSKVVIA